MPTTQNKSAIGNRKSAMPPDRLPKNLLTDEEVIEMLRLDSSETPGQPCDRATSLRRLRYLRDKQRISFHRVGNRTFLYPRSSITRYLKQNLVEAR